MGFFGDNVGKIAGGALGGPVGLAAGWAFDSKKGPFSNSQPPGYSDQPERPNYVPGYNYPGMETEQTLGNRLNSLQMDPRGMNQFRGEALRSGPSAWANLQLAQSGQQAGFDHQRAAETAASQGATQRANLAMRGGLSGGARERIG